MESDSKQNKSRFGLAILDIDNLRGHIQSPLQKQNPNKLSSPKHTSKTPNGTLSKPQHIIQKSMPPPINQQQQHNDYDHDDEEESHTESEEDESEMSASPLSGNVNLNKSNSPNNTNNANNKHGMDEAELKYIDDEDLQTTHNHNHNHHHINTQQQDTESENSSDDDYGLSKIKPEPKSAAERTAAINNQRRKSSIIMRQQQAKILQEYEANKQKEQQQQKDHNNNNEEEEDIYKKNGKYLAVGNDNMDPYLLFWNNSKKGESVVKVVQDYILQSISKDINATHFGFGEFCILCNVSSENELRRIVKKILNKVSSNVSTVKLGPVTLCGGLSMYKAGTSISQWVNQCRQSCRLAKCNGRGRISSYVSIENRRKYAIELMLEIKKPKADFSGVRVLELIRNGADLNFQYKYDTPLMIAIKKRNFAAMRYIIQYDYNPNVQDKKGKTCLMLALERDVNEIILDMLVSKRALNPRITDYAKNSALKIALKKGYRDIAKTLILLGSEPILGDTAVLNQWFSAAKCGNISTVSSMLSQRKFPIDMIDSDDMTALMHASANGHNELCKFLIASNANVNIQGHRGYTALMFAIEHSKIGIYANLIQTDNILIGLNGDDGTTILMCAAKGAMPECIPLAIEHDVDINAVNFDGDSALMIAAKSDSVSVATELLRNHCDFDIVNKNGCNALIICAQNGSSQIAAMLTTLGSAIDVCDKKGMTALMYAAANGYRAIVINLIKFGANYDLEDNEGLNALAHAQKNKQNDIVDMIQSGTFSDVTDILQQMEILKNQNKSLQRNVMQLTQINNELSDRINASELAKNQIQKKLQDTMGKMKMQFSKANIMDSTQHHFSPQNIKEKMSGVSSRFGSMLGSKKSQSESPTVAKPPSKEYKL